MESLFSMQTDESIDDVNEDQPVVTSDVFATNIKGEFLV